MIEKGFLGDKIRVFCCENEKCGYVELYEVKKKNGSPRFFDTPGYDWLFGIKRVPAARALSSVLSQTNRPACKEQNRGPF